MSRTAKTRSCPGCGHDKFTRDIQASAGDLLCLNCGMVQEENPIVSEVQFGESANGAAMVQGAMVGADQARANFNMRNAMESREQTLLNAKKKIKRIANVMRIPDYIVESASGWFKLALVQNFVQGRRSQNVIAACLYVACRHEKTHHLLIDFSSRLQISVYSLGATYLKLVRALQIQRLPLADPSLFIQHFAEKLSFGEHTAKVCRDASKIAHRMSSDWIYEGRRPAGIAGACLLLAARMNNFRRTHAEIVAVARVGEETLQKRLNEFKKTTSGSLTILDFRDSLHSEDSLPPSFSQNRRTEDKIRQALKDREAALKRYISMAKEKRLMRDLRVRQADDDDESDSEAYASAREDEEDDEPETGATEDKKSSISDMEAINTRSAGDELFLPLSGDEDDGFGFEDLPEQTEDVNDDDYEPTRVLAVSKRHKTRLRKLPGDLSDLSEDEAPVSSGRLDRMSSGRLGSLAKSGDIQDSRAESRKQHRKMLQNERKAEEKMAREDALLKSVLDGGSITETDLEKELDRILHGQKHSLDKSLYQTPAELQVAEDFERQIEIDRPRNLVKNNPSTEEMLKRVRDDVLLDENDDDDEVNTIELGEDEILQKERIWTALNHDFLIAQEKKRLKIEADELTGNTSGQTRKRRRVKEQSVDPVLNDAAVNSAIRQIGEEGKSITPAESAKNFLQRKQFSKKINYDSIGDLFDTM